MGAWLYPCRCLRSPRPIMGSRPDSMPIGVSRLSPKAAQASPDRRRETLAPRAIWREVGVEGRGRCRRSIQIPQLSAGIEHDRSKSITPLAQAHPRRIFGRALSNRDCGSQQCDWSASAGPQGARLGSLLAKNGYRLRGSTPLSPNRRSSSDCRRRKVVWRKRHLQ
jgi:hypothetical protein